MPRGSGIALRNLSAYFLPCHYFLSPPLSTTLPTRQPLPLVLSKAQWRIEGPHGAEYGPSIRPVGYSGRTENEIFRHPVTINRVATSITSPPAVRPEYTRSGVSK